jgi:hypothetical protein
MPTANKKPLIILGLLGVIGGVVAYFLWKDKHSSKTESNSEKETPPIVDGNGVASNGSIKTQTNTSIPVTATNTLGSIGDAEYTKSFQDWLDKSGIKWVGATNANLTNGKLLNKGAGYGVYGKSTKKAWERYGSQFINRFKPKEFVSSSYAPTMQLFKPKPVELVSSSYKPTLQLYKPR